MCTELTDSICIGKYENVKELSIGGIIMLKNLSGEKEEIVEPMVVNKVSNSFVKGTGDAVSSDPSFIKWHPHFYREPAVGNNH